MKGKGKGDRNELKDCPLKFPDFKPIDHDAECPRYSAVLQRIQGDEPVVIEEIGVLQTELEILLASVAKRMRVLETEINILNEWQEGKVMPSSTPSTPVASKDKGKGGKGEPGSPSKRSGKGSHGDEKSSKKFKDSSGKAVDVKGTPKGKVQPPPAATVVSTPEVTESPKPKELPKVIKNDAPNRFWGMVEPYCKEITNDDLKVLEDLMQQHQDEGDFYKIPMLGKHYTEKWAHEDMLMEGKERRKSSSSDNFLKRGDDDSSPFGPLTQRLVQALMEENIMTPLDDTTITEADAVEAATISPRSLAKQLNIGNTAALERRIKRELEENGILEFDDRTDESPDDEILIELRKKQQELRTLSQHNLTVTKRLYKAAKVEMQDQELKRKMAVADAEVLEAYRKMQATRSKKKSPSKKEIEAVKRALKERENIVKQIDSCV